MIEDDPTDTPSYRKLSKVAKDLASTVLRWVAVDDVVAEEGWGRMDQEWDNLKSRMAALAAEVVGEGSMKSPAAE